MVVSDYLRFAAELRDVPSSFLGNAVDRASSSPVSIKAVQNRVIGNCSKGDRQRVGNPEALEDPDRHGVSDGFPLWMQVLQAQDYYANDPDVLPEDNLTPAHPPDEVCVLDEIYPDD